MRLAPSAEQRRFADVLHQMLTGADLPGVSAAWANGDVGPGRRLWTALADAGVTGLLVPERWGGLGAGPDDLVIACEELGHHAVPGPIAESIAAVPVLLAGRPATAGTEPDAMADKWLPELVAGRAVASMAAPPWLPLAADGDAADLILLVTGDEVRTGQPGRIHRSMDPARRLAEVLPGGVLTTGPPMPHAINLGVLACAAQLLGAGRALLETAVGYAKTRTQFGRPIGSFQAVRHQLADVAVAIEFARPLLYAAAVALAGTGTATAGRDVSAAKVACGEAAVLAARVALQVHGAVGYTREHGLGRWLTRVRVLHAAWGTPARHRERILAELAGEMAGDRRTPPEGRGTAASRQDVAG
ncbi:acyl-CoA dehydrogenase family protein [Actinoplanes sp. NEAU-A12]|uniref:Acyl-CoA dehydrogenase family protein n=1 Tax=Actinoplanes sandaracinus TaxID=3045177 RepID=A0ABT6WCG6_9ACTN|nr:acyl-CoA dehydrogenase family protein [Actinoplanes sandaracinus]